MNVSAVGGVNLFRKVNFGNNTAEEIKKVTEDTQKAAKKARENFNSGNDNKKGPIVAAVSIVTVFTAAFIAARKGLEKMPNNPFLKSVNEKINIPLDALKKNLPESTPKPIKTFVKKHLSPIDIPALAIAASTTALDGNGDGAADVTQTDQNLFKNLLGTISRILSAITGFFG